jgi:hypothetical protein
VIVLPLKIIPLDCQIVSKKATILADGMRYNVSDSISRLAAGGFRCGNDATLKAHCLLVRHCY